MENMKKFVFLVVVSVLCGIPSWVMGQLKVDTLGTVIVGSLIYNPRINYGKSALYVTDSMGITIRSKTMFMGYRFFSSGSNLHITNSQSIDYTQTLPGGIRLCNGNYLQVYPTSMSPLSMLPSSGKNARFQSFGRSNPAIYATGTPSFYSYGGVIISDVTNERSAPFVSCLVDSSGKRNPIFYVQGDGSVYAKNGLIQSSDISKKENVDSISPRTALNALTALRGVTFSYKGSGGSLTDQPVAIPMRARNAVASDEDSLTEEEETEEVIDESDRISDEVLAQMEAERSRKRIGLIAQEVEQVVPEVVRTLPDGSKGIMYSDLIGMIIEGMKEIQTTVQEQKDQLTARIDSLRTTLDFYKSLIPAVGSSPAPVVRSTPRSEVQPKEGIASSLLNQVVLYQNIPNPFTATTEIIYTLPEGLEDCVIGLYDLNGQLLKQYTLTTLSGKVVIQGNELDKGTYIYTLSCGGQVLASRKIVKA